MERIRPPLSGLVRHPAVPDVAVPEPVARWFAPDRDGPGRLWPRWLWLRGLGLIFFSAFYSLAFQIHGLVGERGTLPAESYLRELAVSLPGVERFWYAPTLLWFGAGDRALTAVVAAGLVCSLLLVLNVWPRVTVALCTLLFMSCVGALQDFSSYQSDGMLLEAGFLSMFFAPPGVWPGLGAARPPSRASRFMLQWEWFRIYFWSGVVKLASGDPHWRDFTAMDRYYETGPMPSWPGWYVQHLPHAYHAMTVGLTFLVELVLVWAMFLPRRFRIALFLVVTPFQLGIIATANYAFLNYLVLLGGVLLLDDEAIGWVRTWVHDRVRRRRGREVTVPNEGASPDATTRTAPPAWRVWVSTIVLSFAFVATLGATLGRALPSPLLLPAMLLEPLRVANQYGLFAVMTEERYDVEFQGTRDGRTWVAYPFRYKPQDPTRAPGIYAPYQPRFDWNLWFASLGPWRQSPWVVLAQERLLEGSPEVLGLFADDPFHGTPPIAVRTVLWRYRFSSAATRRATGRWWDRELLGPFAGTVRRGADGGVELEAVQ